MQEIVIAGLAVGHLLPTALTGSIRLRRRPGELLGLGIFSPKKMVHLFGPPHNTVKNKKPEEITLLGNLVLLYGFFLSHTLQTY